jgi:IclR family acetate operon transcriptional repressor
MSDSRAARERARTVAGDWPSRSASPSAGLQTVERAFAALDLFGPEAPRWGVAEVARELDLSRSTASRLLGALERRGFLMRAGRAFCLGFGAVELGARALRSIDLRERLHPVLVRLTTVTGETTVLATITDHRDTARVIDLVEGREPIRIWLEIGHIWPLHAGALAKALLAFMPDREVALEPPLTKVGINTITTRTELLAELDRIRECGWARSVQETETAAWGVAAPVLDRSGAPAAAIGIISPMHRISPEYESRLVHLLQEAVDDARAQLGLDQPITASNASDR